MDGQDPHVRPIVVQSIEAGIHTTILDLRSLKARGESRPIVGVSGGSRSGKTYFVLGLTAQLARGSLTSHVVPMSGYYYTKTELRQHGCSPDDALNFDAPSSIDFASLTADLRRLKSGLVIPRRRLLYRDDPESPGFPTSERLHDGELVVGRSDVVLVDGLFAHYRELSDTLDFVVFLHQPDTARRKQSRIDRDVNERRYSEDIALQRWDQFVEPSFRRFVYPADFARRFTVDLFIENKY
jgi:uridine kinase